MIAMLEKSVGLAQPPSFAPAWYELSRRYHVASRYADAGHDTVERYEIAGGGNAGGFIGSEFHCRGRVPRE